MRIVGKAVCLMLVSVAPACAVEPLIGLWQMIYQKLGAEQVAPLPIALRVTQSGDALHFEYLKNKELELTRSFVVKVDGASAPITDPNGSTLGMARLKKVSATEYRLSMQAPGRPSEPGTLAITEGGVILRCESEAILPDKGRTHIVQVFAKQ
ncbi:MAG TPA: hypothetical protein VGH38_34285 [Bryobacteraceae bacterium]